MYNRSLTVVDCGAPTETTAVRHYDLENLGLEGSHVVRAPSVGTMVQMWIDAIDAGLWTYDPETDVIEHDWDAMPAEWRLSGFM